MKTLSIFLALILAMAIVPTTSVWVPSINTIAQEDGNGEEESSNGDSNENGNGEEAESGESESETTEEGFEVSVSAENEVITRGSIQKLTVEASDESQVFGLIKYVSNGTRAFVGNTNEDGVFEYEWRIGGNSNPGTFDVLVVAFSQSGGGKAETSFTVQPAAEGPVIEPIPTPGPVPAENGTIPEGNGTDVVPPEPVPIPDDNQTGTGGNQTGNQTTPTPEPAPTPAPTPGNETTPTPTPSPEPETVPDENVTTPDEIEDEVIVVPENETVVVTPENGTDISIPINDTEIVIPTNETVNPEPTVNETEVIVAPENETEVVTPDNATDSDNEIEIPDEVLPVINDTSVIVEGNETDIAENVTAEPEPTPTPVPSPTPNGTIPSPEPSPAPQDDVDTIIADLNERTEVLENQTAESEEVFVAVGSAIEEMAQAISIVPGLTDEEAARISFAVENVKDAVSNAVD